MARARGRYARLHCHNCGRSWGAVVMVVDPDMRALHDIDGETCDRCSLTHKSTRRCAYAPETCTCSAPHVQIVYDSLGDVVRGVQVRTEQRTVFYRMPDGTVSVPGSRDLSDDIAQFAARHGGIRDEAYHLGDLRRLHEDARVPRDPHGIDHDDFSDRSLILDWNSQSIANKDYRVVMDRQLHEEDRMRQEVLELTRKDWGPRNPSGMPRVRISISPKTS